MFRHFKSRRTPVSKRLIEGGLAAIAIQLIASGCGSASHTVSVSSPSAAPNARFQQINLVADSPGVAAHTDPNLVNAWGISFSPSGAFWLSDNGTGLSTLYDGSGAIESLVVTIPPSAAAGSAATGTPSGTVFTGGLGFSGSPAFAFVSEDGALTTWKSGTKAVVSADLSTSGTVFKGLALAQLGGSDPYVRHRFPQWQSRCLRQQLPAGRIDRLICGCVDSRGIRALRHSKRNGNLYVTYARQDAEAHDDVAGSGNGYVDVFSPDGVLVHRLISRGHLNSPWGLALAPTGFGPYSGDLLVGNFGDGAINVYDPSSGAYVGRIADSSGAPLSIPGLWGLAFGNGALAGSTTTLYFSSGPSDESHGLFGSLQSE